MSSNLAPIYKRIIGKVRWSSRQACASVVSRTSRAVPGKVVFLNHFGGGYGCNPKYIAEEMLRRDEFTDLVWLATKANAATVPTGIRVAEYGTLVAMREMATAEVWVDNFRNNRPVPKRDDQYLVQTWHGSIPFKTIEEDAEEHLSPQYLARARQDGRETNLMFANNNLLERIMRESFWYDGPVMRCGVPRNRPLLEDQSCYKKVVAKTYGLAPDVGICLYAPTFRSDGNMDAYRFDYGQVIDALRERFGCDFVFAMRLHPNVVSAIDFADAPGIVDMTSYQDSQELMAAADVLITDYSGMLEDFALTQRPSFMYAPDLADYLRNERGFYYSLEMRPASFSLSLDELCANIINYNQEQHAKEVESFCSDYGYEDDGNGAARVVDRVVSDLHNMRSNL